jgi:hypothetical protein
MASVFLSIVSTASLEFPPRMLQDQEKVDQKSSQLKALMA